MFQAHLLKSEKYQGSVILTFLSPGINDIIEGILFQILPKAPYYRQVLVVCGISTMSVSLVLASCASSAWQIVLTQGVLFGAGGIMLNFVHVSIFSEWFVEKRSSAMSFIWLGWRVGSLGFPLVSQWLLDVQGYEATLRTLAVPILALLMPSLIAFRGRFPMADVQSAEQVPRISTWRLLQTPNLLYYLLVTILFSMVINAPTMFIMSFAEDLSLNSTDQALAYCLRVISAMMGIYAFGKYTDKGLHQQLMVFSTIASSIVYLLVWGFAKDRMTLYVFAIAIGLTSGGMAHPILCLVIC